jgi:hypothetical protein
MAVEKSNYTRKLLIIKVCMYIMRTLLYTVQKFV